MYKLYATVLLIFFSSVSQASFDFSSSSYLASFPSSWTGGVETVELDISLKACWYALGSSCENSILQGPDLYSIGNINTSAVVFSNGSQDLDIIQSLIFTHEANSFDLVAPGSDSNMIYYSNSLDFITGKLALSVQGELADAVQPGTYTASITLQGKSRYRQETDQADVDIDIDIPDRVRVSGLKDINLPYSNGSVSSGWVSFCVFSQGGTDFKLRAYGSNEPDQFLLRSSGGSDYEYDLAIREVGQNSTKEVITPNDSDFSPLYVWQGSDSQTCYNYTQNNMELEVKTRGGANSLPTGLYQDTVTIVVEPD